LDLAAFVFGQRSDEQRGFHALDHTTLSIIFREFALAQHDYLFTFIDQQPWLADPCRRVQHDGYRYDYKNRSVDASQFLGPLPDWSLPPLAQLRQASLIQYLPDQLIINEYLPGQSISPHIDCRPCFGDVIFSLSLGSPLYQGVYYAEKKTAMLLEPRNVFILREEARHRWEAQYSSAQARQMSCCNDPSGSGSSLSKMYHSFHDARLDPAISGSRG